MIYDSIKSLSLYKGIYTNLDKAIDYILSEDISLLAIGRTEIDGDNVYVNVIEGNLTTEEDGVYEFHKEYLDLHIDLVGIERILLSNLNELSITKEYTNDGDNGLGNAKSTAACKIDDNHFCICMIDEPHMPCVKVGNDSKVKKAIFKIKISRT